MPAQTPEPTQLFRAIPYGSVLDQSIVSTRNPGLTIAQNVVYRPFGAVGKRTGSSGYGGVFTPMASGGVVSGTRWYRGLPSAAKQMIAQCGNELYLGNDGTGAWTAIGSLAAGSTPAFYAAAHDPTESGVSGNPASDILIVAYGSGAPKKWDGVNFTPLSATITNAFAGCATWHNHVWFWGDPNNPDTLYATDLANPEGFVFTMQQQPPGYVIGWGDGDATIQVCAPAGNVMAIFKSDSIWLMTGYDFVQGEYQFALQPWVQGVGTSAPHSVAVMNQTLYWFDGANFRRMAFTDTAPTSIGLPIISTAATAAINSQSAMRGVAGNFVVQTVNGPAVYTNVYLCAIDTGSGYADTILMYDDDASQIAGKPAWSIFTGFTIGCFVPWGGPGDQQLLYIGDAQNGQMRLFGGNATADGPNAINVVTTTGQLDCGSADQTKRCRNVWIETLTNAASFNVSILTDILASSTSSQSFPGPTIGSTLGTTTVATTVLGSGENQSYESVPAIVNPGVRGKNFQITIEESSTTAAYDLLAVTLDITVEPYNR